MFDVYDPGHGSAELSMLTGQELSPNFYDNRIVDEDDIIEESRGTQNLSFVFDTLLTALSMTKRPIDKLSAGLYFRTIYWETSVAEELHGVEVSFLQLMSGSSVYTVRIGKV